VRAFGPHDDMVEAASLALAQVAGIKPKKRFTMFA
jgi:hypothetical protein